MSEEITDDKKFILICFFVLGVLCATTILSMDWRVDELEEFKNESYEVAEYILELHTDNKDFKEQLLALQAQTDSQERQLTQLLISTIANNENSIRLFLATSPEMKASNDKFWTSDLNLSDEDVGCVESREYPAEDMVLEYDPDANELIGISIRYWDFADSPRITCKLTITLTGFEIVSPNSTAIFTWLGDEVVREDIDGGLMG